MIVAIHQPQYLPWAPFFDKADRADLFVYLDTVQFHRRGVQNRNQIKTHAGASWLVVPVHADRQTAICEVTIPQSRWAVKHVRSIEQNYRQAKFAQWFDELHPILEDQWEKLSDLNIATTSWMFEKLQVKCRIVKASDLNVTGIADDLLLAICKAVNATVYMSGQGAKHYQDDRKFIASGIEVHYQVYSNQTYQQCHPKLGFVADLSALDLILNLGPEARTVMLAGRKTDEVASAAVCSWRRGTDQR